MQHSRLIKRLLLAAAVVSTAALRPEFVLACPFCSAVGLTFSEEINASTVAVMAKLVETPPRVADTPISLNAPTPKSKFEIIEILKGKEHLAKVKIAEAVYLGDQPLGSTFLMMGIEPPNIVWSTPIALTEPARRYLSKVLALPKEGPDRLAFFLDYVEDPDPLINRDAYDEFAKTPYEGVKAIKHRMRHDELLKWIKDPEIPASRRRLYLTMLGVCGGTADVPMLEEMIRSTDRRTKAGLDALIGCYLTLKGAAGMPLVEELFLKNPKAEYTDTYNAIMALRFHGQDADVIPRERILAGLRWMLDRPALADLVIPDLARWQDWSVMPRLVKLFKEADEESQWVRVPVIKFLQACPDPKAKEYLAELNRIDPDAFRRATMFVPMGGGGQPAPGTSKAPVNP